MEEGAWKTHRDPAQVSEKAQIVQEIASGKEGREDCGKGYGKAAPSQPPGRGEIKVMPVLQPEVESLEEQPKGNRKWQQQEEAGRIGEKTRPIPPSAEKRFDKDDVAPPREGIEPGVERLYLMQHGSAGQKKQQQGSDHRITIDGCWKSGMHWFWSSTTSCFYSK